MNCYITFLNCEKVYINDQLIDTIGDFSYFDELFLSEDGDIIISKLKTIFDLTENYDNIYINFADDVENKFDIYEVLEALKEKYES